MPKNALFRLISQHGVVLLLGGVEHRGAGLDAGVVHHDVQPPERLHGGVDQPLKVGDLADVGVDTDGSIAQGDDSPFEFLGRIRVRHVVNRDVGALLGQLEHDRLSDPAVAAGDDRDLALQKHKDSLYGFVTVRIPRAFIPVDSVFVTSIQHLNRPCSC